MSDPIRPEDLSAGPTALVSMFPLYVGDLTPLPPLPHPPRKGETLPAPPPSARPDQGPTARPAPARSRSA